MLAVLSSGFAESKSADDVVIRQYASEDDYDYESDSDLDDTEEAEDPLKRPSASSSSTSSQIASIVSAKGKSKDSDAGSTVAASETYSTREFGKGQSVIQIPSVAYRTYASARASIFLL